MIIICLKFRAAASTRVLEYHSSNYSSNSNLSPILHHFGDVTAVTRVLVNFYFRLQISISSCSFCGADCSQLMNCWNLWKLGTSRFHLQLQSINQSININLYSASYK